jgi:NAD(P)-dependent dehydrogenase (short-subunit alcohol dehydrogenase family)
MAQSWWWLLWQAVLWLALTIVLLQVLLLVCQLLRSCHKYFWIEELDLRERYGVGSWVIITGASSGQGRHFALEWAKRGFNLFLIGSLRTELVIKEVLERFPQTLVRFVAKDFGEAYKDEFWIDIEQTLKDLPGEVSVLINSVGHRVGWRPYHDMPVDKIRDCIVSGTIVQARLTHLMLPRLINRKSKKRSLIVSITAQCMHPNFALGSGLDNEITVPYLTVYEPTNAWGFYQMQSIIVEYAGQLDMLNITPGAVKTVNTKEALDRTIGAVEDVVYVQNIFRLMGNVNGATCGHWMHAASLVAVNFAPWLKDKILRDTGEKLASTYMRNCHLKSYHLPPSESIPKTTKVATKTG